MLKHSPKHLFDHHIEYKKHFYEKCLEGVIRIVESKSIEWYTETEARKMAKIQ